MFDYYFILAADLYDILGIVKVILLIGFLFFVIFAAKGLMPKRPTLQASDEPVFIPEQDPPKKKYSNYDNESPLQGAIANGAPLQITKGDFVKNRLPTAKKEHWNNINGLRGICALCINNGILDEIDDLIERLVELDPDKPSALYFKADYLIAQGNAKEAVALLNNPLAYKMSGDSSEFTDAPVYLALYKAYKKLGDEVNMQSSLDKGLSIDPNPTAFLDAYFKEYRATHDDDEYENELKRVSKYPGSFFAQFLLANFHFEQDDVLSAMKVFDEIMPLPEKHSHWLGAIGATLNLNNCAKLAYTYYTKYYDIKLGAEVGSAFVKSMILLSMIDEAEALIHKLIMLPNANYRDLNILTNLSFELDAIKVKQNNEEVGELVPIKPIVATYDKPQWMLSLSDFDYTHNYQNKNSDYKVLILPFASAVSTLPNGNPNYAGFDLARQIQLYIQDSLYLRSDLTPIFETQFDEANHRHLTLEEPIADEIIAAKLDNETDITSCIWGEAYIDNDKLNLSVYIQSVDDDEKHTFNMETSINEFDADIAELINDIASYFPDELIHEPILKQFRPTLSYINCLSVMHSQIVKKAGLMKLELNALTRRAILSVFDTINAGMRNQNSADSTLLNLVLFGMLLNDKMSGSEIYKEFELDVRNTFGNTILADRYCEVIGELYGYEHPDSVSDEDYAKEDAEIHSALMESNNILEEKELFNKSIELDRKHNLSRKKPVHANVIEATYSIPQWILPLRDYDIVNGYRFEPSNYHIKILAFSSSESVNANGFSDFAGYGMAREFSLLIQEALYLNCKADVVLSLKVDEANKKLINNSDVISEETINKHFSTDSTTDCYIWGDVKFIGRNVQLTVYSKNRDSETKVAQLDSSLNTLGDDLAKFIRKFIQDFPLKNAVNTRYPISDPMPFYIYSALTSFIFRLNAYSSGLITATFHGETRSRIKDLINWLKQDSSKTHKDLLTNLLLAILVTDKNSGGHIYEEFKSEVIEVTKSPATRDVINSLYQ